MRCSCTRHAVPSRLHRASLESGPVARRREHIARYILCCMLFQLMWTGATAQGGVAPGPEAPTHTCSLVMVNLSLKGSSAGQKPRLSCQGPAGEGGLQVAGGALWTQPGVDGKGAATIAPLPEAETDSARLVFTCGGSVTHLQLQHSVLSGVQLSDKGPLLQLLNCSRVTFDNVTLSGLGAPSAPGSSSTAFGAVHVASTVAVLASRLSCTSVTGFRSWGCLLLEYVAAGGSEPALTVSDSSVLNNTMGPASVDCSSAHGAVVLGSAGAEPLSPGVRVTIERSAFEGNVGGCGGALAATCDLESLTVTSSSRFTSNTAYGDGGSIHLARAVRTITISDGSSISYSTANGTGGAISALRGVTDSFLLAGASRLEYNSVASDGGALYLGSRLEALTLTGGSSLSNNYCQGDGGAVYVAGLGRFALLDDSAAAFNNASSARANYTSEGFVDDGTHVARYNKTLGGVLRCVGDMGSLLISGGSRVERNWAGEGGAVSAHNVGSIIITANGSLSYNEAYYFGGAVSTLITYGDSFDKYGNVTVFTVTDGSRVDGNRVQNMGGVLFTAGTGNLSVANGSSMSFNQAVVGSGGVVFSRQDFRKLVDIATPHIRITGRSKVSDNVSGRNGGAFNIWDYDANVTNTFELSDSSFLVNNYAGSNGGAYYQGKNFGTITITGGSRALNNTAGTGDGGVFRGVDLTRLVIQDSEACGNRAPAGSGGVVSVQNVLDGLDLVNSVLCNNSVTKEGGVVAAKYTIQQLTVRGGSRVYGNSAGDSGGAFTLGLVKSLSITEGSSISNNVVKRGGGGAIALYENKVTKNDCIYIPMRAVISIDASATLSGNRAYGGDGGALLIELGSNSECPDPSKYAGYNNGTTPLTVPRLLLNITSAVLYDNHADGMGGAMAVYQPARLDDGARAPVPRMLRVHLYDSNVSNNSAGRPSLRLSKLTSMSTTTLGGAIFMWAPLPADPPADAAGDALYPQAGDDPGDGGWPMGSAACRLSVDGSAVGSTVLEGNSASKSGGAVALMQCASRFRNARLSGNRATLGGGAVLSILRSTEGGSEANRANIFTNMDAGVSSLQEPTERDSWLRVSGCTLADNVAGEGGSILMQPESTSGPAGISFSAAIAAAGPSAAPLRVTIRDSTFMGNNVTAGNGGVMAVVSASAVTVSSSTFRNNNAPMGSGGVFCLALCERVLVQDSQLHNNTAWSGGAIHLAGAEDPATGGSMAVLHRLGLGDNKALSSAEGVMEDPDNSHSDAGYGGALYISGGVAAAISSCQLMQGNRALFGALLATTQRCSNDTGAAGAVRAAAPAPPAAGQGTGSSPMSPWSATWSVLGAAARSSCWALAVVGGTTLPPPTMEEGRLYWEDVQVWVRNEQQSAAFVNCTDAGGEDLDAVRYAIQSSLGVRDTVVNGFDMLASDAGTASRERYASLANQLGQCIANNTAVYGNNASTRTDVLFGGGLLAVKPVSIKLVSLRQAGRDLLQALSSGALQLTTADPFDVSVQLYDSYGYDITADVAAINVFSVELGLLPRAPSLPPSLAKLEGPVADRSLAKQLEGGRASWLQVQAQGWPGAYNLTVNVSVVNDIYNVSSLTVEVELMPCWVGEALQRASQLEPSWTRCQSCGKGQVVLWRDERPELQSSVYADTMDARKAMVGAYMQLVGNGNGPATCHQCPSVAQCTGGAVVVPQPGYWHSAANSTKIHRCPYSSACGRSSYDTVDDWGDPPFEDDNATLAVFGATLQDARSQLLGICQRAWYESWPPGSAVAASYLAAATPAEPRTAAAPCMLWQEPAFGVQQDAFAQHSYMQLQCAPGYTGTLCAACEPGGYINSAFQCNDCLSPGASAAIGLVIFFVSVAIVLLTTLANLREDYTAPDNDGRVRQRQYDNSGAAEILKAMIVYLQYLVIVGRLSIPFPEGFVVGCVRLLSSLSWAGNVFAFSPACLVAGLDSTHQARAQVGSGLVTPCLVVLVSMALWALRYRFFNTSLLVKSSGSAKGGTRRSRGRSDPLHLLQLTPEPTEPTPADGSFREPSLHGPEADTRTRAPGYAAAGPAGIYTAPVNADMVGVDIVGHVCVHDGAASGADSPGEPAPGAGATRGVEPCSAEGKAAAKVAELEMRTLLISGKEANSSFARDADAPAPKRRQEDGEDDGRLSPCEEADLPATSIAAKPSSTPVLSSTKRSSDLPPPKMSKARKVIVSAVAWAKQPSAGSALVHCDQSLSLVSQLGIVGMVAVFFLYPGWVQATLSIFSCYRVDDGEGSYPQHQQATWPHGYWVLNMNQECYAGEHRRAFLPIGILALMVFCLAPPLASFLLLWHVRRQGLRRAAAEGQLRAPDPLQSDLHIKQVYGFLYRRYKPRYWWWESVVQLQVLVLVAAEVFGRVLPVSQNALMLMAVLGGIAFTNMMCAPVRDHLLVLLEYGYLTVLSLTITLGLYFTGSDSIDGTAMNAVGAVIITLNAAMLAAFIYFLLYPLWVKLSASVSGAVRGSWRLRSRKMVTEGRYTSAPDSLA